MWRLDTSNGEFVVRLAAPRPGRVAPPFAADFGIRRVLSGLGVPVAEPITGSFERPGVLDRAWLVDRFVEGEAVGKRTLSDGEAKDLGLALRAIHSVPAAGYGRMVDQLAPLIGRAGSPDAGLQSRFQQPWPCGGPPIRDHPLAKQAPELAHGLEPFGKAIVDASARWAPALAHADLHGGQMLVRDGRLAALLDFADASVLSPVWDFASLTYFHGREAAATVASTYEADQEQRASLLHDGRLVSVATAFHHASRAEALELPARRARVVAYLKEWLADPEP